MNGFWVLGYQNEGYSKCKQMGDMQQRMQVAGEPRHVYVPKWVWIAMIVGSVSPAGYPIS
jgi:hypothetical protein